MQRHLVLASALNIRMAPERDAGALGSVPRFTSVEEIDFNDDERSWLMVKVGALKGWCHNAYLIPEDVYQRHSWIAAAAAEFGTGEHADTEEVPENRRVQAYLASVTGQPAISQSDETAWCSGFVNWCIERTHPTDSITLAARSWSDWGVEGDGAPGDIAVLWRRPSRQSNPEQYSWPRERLKREGWNGHVAFLIERRGDRMILLGGNQSSAANRLGEVNKKAYAIDSEDHGLLSFRRPG